VPAARQQVQQEPEIAVPREDLLDADHRDVALRRREAEARVALVGHQHDPPALRDDEVGAGQADIRLQILVPQVHAGAAGDRLRVVVVGAEAMALERGRDLATVLVDDRLDDVRGMVAVDLDDEFTEVGLDAIRRRASPENARARSLR
jgi:hypothetical protein